MNRGIRIRTLVIASLAIAAVALLAGCSGSPVTTGSSAIPSSAVATPPTIKVLAPVAGASIEGTQLDIRTETTGLKFVNPSNTVVPGEGHVHFTLDDQPFKMSVTPDYAFKDVAPGQHTLRAELVQNDTKPFDPAVFEIVTFTVE